MDALKAFRQTSINSMICNLTYTGVLRSGESKFSAELLGELIKEAEQGLAASEETRDKIKRELNECKYRKEEMRTQYDEVISWTQLYDAADLTAKKMIVANLINYVEVSADYELHIDMNIDLALFGIHLNFCTFGQEKAA